MICDPLDESHWTEVRLAGLEFASTLLRQSWRFKAHLFFNFIELYLFLEQSVGSGMDPDPGRKK